MQIVLSKASGFLIFCRFDAISPSNFPWSTLNCHAVSSQYSLTGTVNSIAFEFKGIGISFVSHKQKLDICADACAELMPPSSVSSNLMRYFSNFRLPAVTSISHVSPLLCFLFDSHFLHILQRLLSLHLHLLPLMFIARCLLINVIMLNLLC